MTLTLILTRHAKSDWGDPQSADHDRTLNTCGRECASGMGEWLRRQGYLPDQAMVSTARRAAETWEGMAPSLGDPEVTFHRRLYHATPETMLAHLDRATGNTVLLIGHNPGIAALAASLVAIPPVHPRFSDYPTTATLVVRFDIERWSTLKRGTGAVVDFTVPRDLME